MSKPTASRAWICAFCIVPVIAIIAISSFVFSPARHGRTAQVVSAASQPASAAPAARLRVQANYGALPLAFEQNQGQTDPQVKYLARGHGYTLFLTANDAVFSLQSRPVATGPSAAQSSKSELKNFARRDKDQKDSAAVVRMHLVDSNSQATVEGSGPMAGTANYFLGNDPSKWHSGVARYARVSYQNVYPGVNMAFHGEHELEFDFVLAI